MSTDHKFTRVWMPMGDEGPQIPVFEDVLEIKDAGEAMEQLFPWILHIIRTVDPEDMEDLVADAQ